MDKYIQQRAVAHEPWILILVFQLLRNAPMTIAIENVTEYPTLLAWFFNSPSASVYHTDKQPTGGDFTLG